MKPRDDSLCTMADVLACTVAGFVGTAIGVAVIVVARWKRWAR